MLTNSLMALFVPPTSGTKARPGRPLEAPLRRARIIALLPARLWNDGLFDYSQLLGTKKLRTQLVEQSGDGRPPDLVFIAETLYLTLDILKPRPSSCSASVAPNTKGNTFASFRRCSSVSALKKSVYGFATMCCGWKLKAAMSRKLGRASKEFSVSATLEIELGQTRQPVQMSRKFLDVEVLVDCGQYVIRHALAEHRVAGLNVLSRVPPSNRQISNCGLEHNTEPFGGISDEPYRNRAAAAAEGIIDNSDECRFARAALARDNVDAVSDKRKHSGWKMRPFGPENNPVNAKLHELKSDAK